MGLQERLSACLRQAVENHEAAGVSLLVQKDGKELCHVREGYADIAAGKPLRRDSIFRLYSQSKPVTAAAAMILVDRGILDLMAPVEQYLPGFANPRVVEADGTVHPAVRGPWVMDLLGMTSGACYPDADPAGQYAARVFDEDHAQILAGGGMSTLDFCNRLGELPLAFEPGTRWRYGTSADILGAVIEAASGKRFSDFLREELFEPLGMKDTAFCGTGFHSGRLRSLCRYADVRRQGGRTADPFRGGGAVYDDTAADRNNPEGCLGQPRRIQLQLPDAGVRPSGAGVDVHREKRIRLGRLAGNLFREPAGPEDHLPPGPERDGHGNGCGDPEMPEYSGCLYGLLMYWQSFFSLQSGKKLYNESIRIC